MVILFKFFVAAILLGIFLWLFVFKIIALFVKVPCPASVSFLVDNPVRKRYTRSIIDHIGIRSGETVLELGCGPGVFSFKAQKRLGANGRLISVDIQEEMVRKLKKTITEKKAAQIHPTAANAYHLPFKDNSIDRTFLVECYPEIPDKDKALQELFRVLKADGTLSITEEFLDPAYPLARSVVKNVGKHGFRLNERFGSFLLYTLNFKRT
jgi:ubiquinone/menaquinone biosynthesis C-methylase UbiE